MADLNKLPPPERMPMLEDDVTLRDRFAMAALPVAYEICRLDAGWPRIAADVSDVAYQLADEMMKARK